MRLTKVEDGHDGTSEFLLPRNGRDDSGELIEIYYETKANY